MALGCACTGCTYAELADKEAGRIKEFGCFGVYTHLIKSLLWEVCTTWLNLINILKKKKKEHCDIQSNSNYCKVAVNLIYPQCLRPCCVQEGLHKMLYLSERKLIAVLIVKGDWKAHKSICKFVRLSFQLQPYRWSGLSNQEIQEGAQRIKRKGEFLDIWYLIHYINLVIEFWEPYHWEGF
jgi:hypothetical protein